MDLVLNKPTFSYGIPKETVAAITNSLYRMVLKNEFGIKEYVSPDGITQNDFWHCSRSTTRVVLQNGPGIKSATFSLVLKNGFGIKE